MKKLIWLIVLVILAVVAYGLFSDRQAAMPEEAKPINVALAALNNSGESGVATFEEVDGQIRVAIKLTGGPEDVPQPAHLHKGSCAALGEPIYNLSLVMNGASETTLPISRQAIAANLPLALNVHQSADQVNVYVACGEVTAD